jgi:hypothetical protein
MTGVGVTLYLLLVMHNYVLAALAAGFFAHLMYFMLSLPFCLGKMMTSLALKGLKEQMEN